MAKKFILNSEEDVNTTTPEVELYDDNVFDL